MGESNQNNPDNRKYQDDQMSRDRMKEKIRLIREEMGEKDFELYIYSLQKLAEVSVESNYAYLTDLYNLRAFLVKAQETMLDNPTQKFALVVLDFDNFNAINEFCGRESGDELLMYTARTLLETFANRENVVLSHFRADIFAFLMPFKEQQEIVDSIEVLDRKLAEFKIPYKVLPAFGVCIADSPTTSVSFMRDYASMALSTIKGKFYAKYAFFDDEFRRQMLMNKMIENDIVGALEKNQIVLYVQPKVDMENGRIVGGEALVRWEHPEKGLVMPGEFIPVLEKNGLIIDVDACIWRQVYQFISDRRKAGKRVVPISINISRQHVFDSAFRDRIVELTETYQVPPDMVVLELTESGFLEDAEKMYEHLRFLKAQGFTISMDDFGTGYSTMTMLKNQPVDEVKVDRGFIEDLENPKSRSILRHTLDMLHDLELKIITEGVETKEQADFLLQCGCRTAQGYLYYKPMKAEQFAVLLDENK